HLPDPADNSLHMPAQLDGNGVLTVTDRAHPADLPVDVNQLPSFKFADDGSSHPAADTGRHTIPHSQINLPSIAPKPLAPPPAVPCRQLASYARAARRQRRTYCDRSSSSGRSSC